jgi:hypothetical protein
MHSFPLLACLALAGCTFAADPAAPPILEAASGPSLAALAPKIQATFSSAKLTGAPRVSMLRKAPVTALADWIVCLRSDSLVDSRIYALLIRDNDIVEYRLALLIDECANERFEPLPMPLPAK